MQLFLLVEDVSEVRHCLDEIRLLPQGKPVVGAGFLEKTFLLVQPSQVVRHLCELGPQLERVLVLGFRFREVAQLFVRDGQPDAGLEKFRLVGQGICETIQGFPKPFLHGVDHPEIAPGLGKTRSCIEGFLKQPCRFFELAPGAQALSLVVGHPGGLFCLPLVPVETSVSAKRDHQDQDCRPPWLCRSRGGGGCLPFLTALVFLRHSTVSEKACGCRQEGSRNITHAGGPRLQNRLSPGEQASGCLWP